MATRPSDRGSPGAGTTGRIGGSGMRAINATAASLQRRFRSTSQGPRSSNRRRAMGGG